MVTGAVGISPRIDWEQWADGRTWELQRGEDFEQSASNARRAVIAWANRRQLAIRTSVPDPDTLRIQIT